MECKMNELKKKGIKKRKKKEKARNQDRFRDPVNIQLITEDPLVFPLISNGRS